MFGWRGGLRVVGDTVSITPDLTFYTTSSGYYRITFHSTLSLDHCLSHSKLDIIYITWNSNWKSDRINLNCCNHDTINHLQNNFISAIPVAVGLKILLRIKILGINFEVEFVHLALFLILSQLKQKPSKRCIVHQSYMAIQARLWWLTPQSVKDKMFNVSEMIIQSMFCPISSADKPDWWWCCCYNSKCILISSLLSSPQLVGHGHLLDKTRSETLNTPARSTLVHTD